MNNSALPIIRIELEGFKQCLFHAFERHKLNLDEQFRLAVERACDPAAIQTLLDDEAKKHIAAARSFTPQAARALLAAIEMFELLHASSALETICREWEESK